MKNIYVISVVLLCSLCTIYGSSPNTMYTSLKPAINSQNTVEQKKQILEKIENERQKLIDKIHPFNSNNLSYENYCEKATLTLQLYALAQLKHNVAGMPTYKGNDPRAEVAIALRELNNNHSKIYRAAKNNKQQPVYNISLSNKLEAVYHH